MNKIELVLGQTVLLELEEECLLGELLHVSSDRSFIRLSDVRDMITKESYGIQTYYNSEIRNIQVIASDKAQIQTGPSEKAPDNSVKSTQLSIANLDDTLEQINNYVFIHQTDVKYHDSIRYLKKQRYFGIAMEGIEHGRHSSSLSLLSIATYDSIYIFDIKWMKITDEIRDLLCNDRYRRVLHNGRLVKDVLQHKFGVHVGKCFDVMVAHIAISKTENKSVIEEFSLQACVQSYLKLPANFFDVNINFNERPVNDSAKREAAKHVVFLLPLQDLFIHDIMLEPFYSNCSKYLQSLSRNPDFINSLTDLRNKNCEAIEAVTPVKLGINVELLDVPEEPTTILSQASGSN
uniref:3'-5' exonuclease domain-containing protein n=1 Tax=Anopheles christyi TaxID=43041 RepID=A0A182K890_9DIPT